MERSVEYLRLSLVRDGKDGFKKLRKHTKETVWQGEDVLIDKIQYWKDNSKTKYFVIVRAVDAPLMKNACYYAFTLYNGKTNLGTICTSSMFLMENIIENLWMSAQHLMIDDFDGNNVAWDYFDFKSWWREKIKNNKYLWFMEGDIKDV